MMLISAMVCERADSVVGGGALWRLVQRRKKGILGPKCFAASGNSRTAGSKYLKWSQRQSALYAHWMPGGPNDDIPDAEACRQTRQPPSGND